MATVFILTCFKLSGDPLGLPQRITTLPIRIGRNGLNDFVIDHSRVSSFHACIDDIGGRLCVTDLSSKNGTHVMSDGAIPRMLAPNHPSDLQPSGFEFFLNSDRGRNSARIQPSRRRRVRYWRLFHSEKVDPFVQHCRSSVTASRIR